MDEDSVFPWNDMISLTTEADRGVGIALSAIHEQLCVVAALLRKVIGQDAARWQRIAEKVDGCELDEFDYRTVKTTSNRSVHAYCVTPGELLDWLREEG